MAFPTHQTPSPSAGYLRVGYGFFIFGLLVGALLFAAPFGGRVGAASLTSVSDTLSTSDISTQSNHTITFTMPNGVSSGQTITITFPAGFDLSRIGTAEFDVASTSGDYDLATTTSGTTWGVNVTGQVVTLTNGTNAVASGTTLTVQIGTNATHNTQGYQRISNPGSEASYTISIAGTVPDSGATEVVIMESVTLTASVNTSLFFSVAGVASSSVVNNSPTTTSTTTTATSIPFGLLVPNQSKTAAQDLTVTTNANNGYIVTVQQDGNLRSSSGADINTFKDGANTATPEGWAAPSANPSNSTTWGHFGVTSNDADLNAGEFTSGGGDKWAGDFTTTSPRVILSNGGPSDGLTQNVGVARVGYQIQISTLQEAGNDYANTLTYVVTPTF